MKHIYKYLVAGVLASVVAVSVIACGKKKPVDLPTTGALTMPDYRMALTGVIARFKDDKVLLLVGENEPIVLTGDMNFDGLKNGDELTIYCDDIAESYPEETIVKEMVLKSRGNDLPAELMKKLEELGWEAEE